MYPRPFDYVRADSVEQALDLKAETGGRFIAGGHSLLPMMKIRLTAPAALVDIGHLDDLRGISKNGGFSIGALTTHAVVEAQDYDAFPAGLREAASMIGDPQVRNRGTVGGNVAHADPASDLPTVFSALGATMKTQSKNGTREIAADDFFTGMFESALEEDEILTAIEVASESGRTGSAYAKMFNPASRYAVVGACATVDLDDDGTCTSARVAVGGLTPKAVVLDPVADALQGNPVTEENVKEAAQTALEVVGDDVMGDTYASAEYRKRMLPVFVSRALAKAASRAG
ncbi:MAG: FAD binding domain-containing protein [Actinomycetota bacterium]